VFNIGAGVQVGKIEEAIKVILNELKEVKNIFVGEKELQKAKDYIKGKSILALEDNQVRLDWFLEAAAFKPKIQTPQEVFAKVDAVTAQAVQAVAKDLFNAKKMTLAIIGPYKSGKAFRKLLKV
jgi:predicted Zn-dependent peptidase